MLVKRSGVPRLSSHGLRHTAATHIVSGAADLGELRAVADILGHSPEMLLRVYAHALPASVRAVADRVGQRDANGGIAPSGETRSQSFRPCVLGWPPTHGTLRSGPTLTQAAANTCRAIATTDSAERLEDTSILTNPPPGWDTKNIACVLSLRI